jgi:uncharacterized protein YidB (DUF937 family)
MSGSSGHGSGGIAGNLPTGVKLAAAGLLLHLLMKHARSGEAPASAAPSGAEPSGGGLGGILGGLFGPGGKSQGSGAGAGGGLLGGLLSSGALGGLGGLLGSLRSHGLGKQVDSWVSPGQNQEVSPSELQRSIDPADLDEAARQAGTDRDTVLSELSRMLPTAVDRMTPGGRIPQREEELGSGGLGGLLSQILGGGAQDPRR